MSNAVWARTMHRTRIEGILRRTHGLHDHVAQRQLVAYFLAYRTPELGKH